MAGSEKSGKKWLACGCFGCLGMVALVLLVVSAFFGRAWMGVRNEQVVERVLEPALPVAAVGDPATGAVPGRVVLRLRAGEFHIEPAGAGESLHVDAKYDERAYELRERFEPGEDGWVYELDFEGKGSTWLGFFKAAIGGTQPRVDVYLPSDVPLELVIDLLQGGAAMELGGLWLTSAEIEFSQGGFELEVSEPMREPMESLAIRGSMGGFIADGLGDASPRRLEVDCRMGGAEIDLRGNWLNDSDISISTSQGGASLRLPRDVTIVGLGGDHVGVRGGAETPLPTLTFSVTARQGELEIIE